LSRIEIGNKVKSNSPIFNCNTLGEITNNIAFETPEQKTLHTQQNTFSKNKLNIDESEIKEDLYDLLSTLKK